MSEELCLYRPWLQSHSRNTCFTVTALSVMVKSQIWGISNLLWMRLFLSCCDISENNLRKEWQHEVQNTKNPPAQVVLGPGVSDIAFSQLQLPGLLGFLLSLVWLVEIVNTALLFFLGGQPDVRVGAHWLVWLRAARGKAVFYTWMRLFTVPSQSSLCVPGDHLFSVFCVLIVPQITGYPKNWIFQSAEITRVAGGNVGSSCRKRPNTVLPPCSSSPLCLRQEARATPVPGTRLCSVPRARWSWVLV